MSSFPESPQPFLLAGSWEVSTQRDPVINPYTGHTVAQVCQADERQIEQAIDAAHQAFLPFRSLPSYARAEALTTIAREIARHKEEFASLICQEAGKPLTDARREVDRGVQTFVLASEEAKRIEGEVIPMDLTKGMERHWGIVRRVPIGPVLGITPFNFPLNLVAHKVAPCLAVGNPIVLKPAPQTPLTALRLGAIIARLDLPPGTLSVIPCETRLAERMVQDYRFGALSFTGSETIGWMLKGKAGKKRVLLELGGNAGVIVEPDADLDLASRRCVTGGFSYSGQTCISVQRIFVHEEIYDRFRESIVGKAGTLVTGDPQQESTVVGPLINEPAAIRVESWVQEAQQGGARVLLGGNRNGTIVSPTVLDHVQSGMKVSCKEVFGPVVTLTPYHDFKEALRLLNDSPFGLQAGIYTNDINKIFLAYQELDVGTVLANEIPTFRADHMPYGGVKDSGAGREGVKYAMDDLTELKLLVLNLTHR